MTDDTKSVTLIFMKRTISVLLFLFFFLTGGIVSPSVGVSWDEPDNIVAGGTYVKFFTSGFDSTVLTSRDQSASVYEKKIFSQEPSLQRYPPFPLYIGVFFTQISERIFGLLTQQEIIASFHFASAFFLGILVMSVYLFATVLGLGTGVSIATAVLTGLHPSIFGYGITTIKDSAQMSLFVITLFILVQSTLKKSKKYFIFGAVLWGCAMATKINAIFIPIVWAVWVVFSSKQLTSSSLVGSYLRAIPKVLLKLIVLALIGIMVMILIWPYLWFDPLGRLYAVFTYFTTVGTGYTVFWNGAKHLVGTGKPLPWYPIVHMIIGTPIPILILAGLGMVDSVVRIVKNKGTHHNLEVLVFLWLLIPLSRTLSGTAAFYDGMRHFLEALPALCLFAGLGMYRLYSWRSKFSIPKQLYIVSFVGLATYLGFILWFFFPYTSGYVNAFIRNPNSIVERDFGGLSVKEAVDQVHQRFPGPHQFFVPIAGHLSWYYLTGNDMYVYYYTESDIVILPNKPSHLLKEYFDTQVYGLFDLVGEIRRGNNVFAWIYKRK